MRVTFIRHGASEWTGRSLLCGRTDVPLSTTGRLQVDALAAHLAGRRFDALWSSPLRRAKDTAAAVGATIGHAAVLDARLQEIDLGQLEGMTFAELPKGPGTFRDRWQKRPGTVRFPRGENLQEVARRGWLVLEELFHQHPQGHVVVVSHMFAISALLCRVLGIRVGRFRTFAVDTASLTTVQMDAGAFRLLQLNDTAHLASLAEVQALRVPALPARG